MTKYGRNQRYLADYWCCNHCGTGAESVFASASGVIIDCQALSIKSVQICDATYNDVLYLQNCPKYVGATGSASVAHVSIATIVILSIATFLTIF